MMTMKTLDPITLPLNCSSLIEASAGTGKTHTIKNLYLRLLLGLGHDKSTFQPLTVAQILVVTFTKAATEELRERIRENIQACYTFFQERLSGKETQSDDFFEQLFEQVENKEEALLRLRIAEREIDLASVFTIHSFCQKMLFQFAFDSGVRFDIELKADQSELMLRLAQEVWREQFYPMGLKETQIIAQELKTPQEALKLIRSYLNDALPELGKQQQIFSQPISDYLNEYQRFFTELKDYWREYRADIVTPIQNELEKKYKTGEKKALSRQSYKKNLVENWIKTVEQWVESDSSSFPANAFERFCQQMLIEKAEEGGEPLTSPHFAKNQAFLTAYQTQFEGKIKPVLLYHFLLSLREKIAEHQIHYSERGFDDLLKMLNQALKGERGELLAAQIRAQFPFAMIDEFQDTDKTQYDIFRQIFMSEKAENQGFIMIGDPKQSIYKFRGADIFTYLEAANQAKEKRTLSKNWRSFPEVVESVNQLFFFPQHTEASPFLHKDIHFQPVRAKEFTFQLMGSEHVVCYLQTEFDEEQAAEHCAAQIQLQLKAMQEKGFGVEGLNDSSRNIFQAKDIAVLVRSRNQASLVKNALAQRGIKAVFLSEKSSVYQSEVAYDLAVILKACLHPYHQKTLLSALGSHLWGLTAFELYQLKHDESVWESYVANFVVYQQLWQKQGVLAMLHQLFLNEGIIQRLKSRENAERLITDLFHLAELLQSGSQEVENETALLRWYERHLEDDEENDAYTLRLESEENLVKIVTIHGSKGLQYPVVWLPFVGKNSYENRNGGLATYHDEEDQKQWDFNEKDERIQRLRNQAEFAEDLRLLYVVLTRAEYQMNLILPAHFAKGWNAMHYLLSNGELALDNREEAAISTEDYIKAKNMPCKIEYLPEQPRFDDWRADADQQEVLSVLPFEHRIPQREGQITSFTALYSYHEWKRQSKDHNEVGSLLTDLAQDYDQSVSRLTQTDELEQLDTALNAYHFPHGTKIGNMLHQFFEHYDFQQAVEKTEIIALCEKLALDEIWVEPICQWFEKVRTTPFGEDLVSLSEITQESRLNEWQFFLRLNNEDWVSELNHLLKEHSELAKHLPPLKLPDLEGFVRGFIDCIAKVKGKFYVIDYKSNFLGYLPQDYSTENLAKTMGQYRYDLQYLLYTLAVHRYLKGRLGEQYDYQRDFGGVAYLFLRGMNGSPQSGAYFDKPSLALIEGLDRLFN